PMEVNSETINILEKFASLNPLHNKIAYEGIELSLKTFQSSRHFAIFDTDFHKTIPEHAKIYGLDYEFYLKGIKKYGFHGISYSYLLDLSKEILNNQKPNLIALHLGSGSSACAIKEGASFDTSMGFSPLEGLLMLSRPGDIDAGVILELLKLGYTAKELEEMLYKNSGIRAIAKADDFETLLKLKANDAIARLAYEAFLHRIIKYVGAYWVLLGNVDVLVFSGGIGENSYELRQDLCKALEPFGVKIDNFKNRENATSIETKDSKIKVLVLKTDEEMQMVKILIKHLGW
ncbi:MAG: acetate/propionate family kinase, partial [Aquificaceae bacterium]|nr:acetate/propionate family kinase [Aquificaceae bacterium]MDW8237604.1 acetate/propionate family kinase [Aquificaceae bacterium]